MSLLRRIESVRPASELPGAVPADTAAPPAAGRAPAARPTSGLERVPAPPGPPTSTSQGGGATTGRMLAQVPLRESFRDAKFRIQLQSKKDCKKNGGKSPDKADSLALTFVPELIDRKVVMAKVRPVVRRTVIWTR